MLRLLLLSLLALAGCSYTRFDATRPDGLRVSGAALNFINDRSLSVSSSPEDGFSGSYSNSPNADIAGRAFGTIDKALDKIPGVPAVLEAREP